MEPDESKSANKNNQNSSDLNKSIIFHCKQVLKENVSYEILIIRF